MVTDVFDIATDFSKVPVPYMRGSIREYVEFGRPVGDFLNALLTNRLRETYSYADESNRNHIREWIQFVYAELPARSHGSEQKIAIWLSHKGASGLNDYLETQR